MSLYATPFDRTLADQYFGDNPNLGYRRWLNQNAVDPFSTFGQFAQGQYGRLYEGFNVEAPNRDMNWTFTDYLNENGGFGNLKNQFRNLSPQQRGENSAAFQGRPRWFL